MADPLTVRGRRIIVYMTLYTKWFTPLPSSPPPPLLPLPLILSSFPSSLIPCFFVYSSGLLFPSFSLLFIFLSLIPFLSLFFSLPVLQYLSLFIIFFSLISLSFLLILFFAISLLSPIISSCVFFYFFLFNIFKWDKVYGNLHILWEELSPFFFPPFFSFNR